MKLPAFVKEKRHRWLPLAVAFCLPVLLLLALYAAREVYPFGQNSLLILDMNAQYVCYFDGFRSQLLAEPFPLYSWSRSLGGELLGLWAYYLASPFTLVTLLLPGELITESVLLMTLLKAGSCSLTFALFLKFGWKLSYRDVLPFSVLYALSGYFMVQAMNLMWIDGMIFAPLILWGLHRLFDSKGFGLYLFSLAALFCANYYIGYMTALFTGLYALWYLLCCREGEFRQKARSFLTFLGYSLLGAALSAWVLLPVFYSLNQGKFSFSTPDFSPKFQLDLLDLLAKLLPASYDTVRWDGLPFLYAGVLPLLLTPLYFTNCRTSLKERLGAGLVLLSLIGSMAVSTLDLAWHGFQAPNWLPYRYSFLVSLFLLLLSARAFAHRDASARPALCKTAGILLLLLAVLQKLPDYPFLEQSGGIWIACVFLLLDAILLFFLFQYRQASIYCAKASRFDAPVKGEIPAQSQTDLQKTTLGLAVLVLLSCQTELLANGRITLERLDQDVIYSTRPSYRNFMDRMAVGVDWIQEQDPGFYRMEKTDIRTVNDPFALGYAGISHSSSSLNQRSIETVRQLGYAARAHWTRYQGGTPLSDSLLGIKYLLSDQTLEHYRIYGYLDEVDLLIYENPTALPLVFGASSDAARLTPPAPEEENLFVWQNEIMNRLLGTYGQELPFFQEIRPDYTRFYNLREEQMVGCMGYFPETPQEEAYLEWEFTGTGKPVYFHFPTGYEYPVKLYVNGEFLSDYFENESYRIMSMGTPQEGETVTLRLVLTEQETYFQAAHFYTLNLPLLEDACEALSSTVEHLELEKNNRISAQITIKKDGMLFTTIPYETGWHLQIDGKTVSAQQTAGGLLCAPMESGSHTVTLTFFPAELLWGIVISLGAAGGTVWLWVKEKQRQKRAKKLLLPQSRQEP